MDLRLGWKTAQRAWWISFKVRYLSLCIIFCCVFAGNKKDDEIRCVTNVPLCQDSSWPCPAREECVFRQAPYVESRERRIGYGSLTLEWKHFSIFLLVAACYSLLQSSRPAASGGHRLMDSWRGMPRKSVKKERVLHASSDVLIGIYNNNRQPTTDNRL